MNTEHAGYRLKKYRESLGITQARVAEALGVTRGAVSQFENSAVGLQNFSKLCKLAKLYQTTVNILTNSDEMVERVPPTKAQIILTDGLTPLQSAAADAFLRLCLADLTDSKETVALITEWESRLTQNAPSASK